jgi:hypothetical protein
MGERVQGEVLDEVEHGHSEGPEVELAGARGVLDHSPSAFRPPVINVAPLRSRCKV